MRTPGEVRIVADALRFRAQALRREAALRSNYGRENAGYRERLRDDARVREAMADRLEQEEGR